MKCYCIQNWFENPQCRLPGEPHTLFPLTPACPADFIFNMDALASFNLSGRGVPFREFSFLDNERTPSVVKVRRRGPAGVAAPGGGRAGCGGGIRLGLGWQHGEEAGVGASTFQGGFIGRRRSS